jgi:hypothetical protein
MGAIPLEHAYESWRVVYLGQGLGHDLPRSKHKEQ